MTKTLVNRGNEKARVPFLRGILTRSLQDAGLSFEDAYQVASTVRDALRDASEVTADEIRDLTLPYIEPYGEVVLRRYRRPPSAVPTVMVRYPDGHVSTYSRGRHRLALAPTGLSVSQAARVAGKFYARLASDGVSEIASSELGRSTYRLLAEEIGSEPAHRYAVWEEFSRSDRPLLILVGGATATGKSTVATQLSHCLEIVRTQSTDMLREVMRMMVPQRLLPVLHTSSFLAWQAIPAKDRMSEDPDALLADGYLTQVGLLSVACEAVFQRALHERVSLILEGVHVHPSLLRTVPGDTDAIVVPLMLGVLNPDLLESRIRGRGKQVPGRRAKRYLENLDAIWRLQSFLLSEADGAHIPIVTNDDMDVVVREVVSLVMDELGKHFAGDSEKVFGA